MIELVILFLVSAGFVFGTLTWIHGRLDKESTGLVRLAFGCGGATVLVQWLALWVLLPSKSGILALSGAIALGTMAGAMCAAILPRLVRPAKPVKLPTASR